MLRPAARAPYSNLRATAPYAAFQPLSYMCTESRGGHPYPARDALQEGCRQKTSAATSSSVCYRYISRLTETPVTTGHCTAYAYREQIEGVPSGSFKLE
jgi:hypothetical protein